MTYIKKLIISTKFLLAAVLLLLITANKEIAANDQKYYEPPKLEKNYAEKKFYNTDLTDWTWVLNTISHAMNFGFSDYSRKFHELSPHFSQDALKQYNISLQKNNILQSVRLNRLVVTTRIISLPTILEEGKKKDSGYYYWVFEVPVHITYEAGAKWNEDNMKILIEITKAPDADNKARTLITKWELKKI